MISAIQSIVQEYGVKKVSYSIVTFGNQPDVRLLLKNQFGDKNELKRLLSTYSRSFGEPNLEKALSKSREMFSTANGHRDGARKVVVVLIDKRSVSSDDDVRRIVERYETEKIKIVPVIFGNEIDSTDVVLIAPDKNKDNVVSTTNRENPDVLGKRIMDAINRGQLWLIVCLSVFFDDESLEGVIIRATKSCNSSHNVVALQVAERMLFVLPPRAQQIFFVVESRKNFYFVQQSRTTTKFRVVIRATFATMRDKLHDFVFRISAPVLIVKFVFNYLRGIFFVYHITYLHIAALKDPCLKTVCKFYSRCVKAPDNTVSCVCSSGCTEDYNPVCGSNKVTYTNNCSRMVESCSTKTDIWFVKNGACAGSI